ncbi:discoidin domain-containing protein [Fulvivirga sp. M361]|uniref:discoidin domain-containing protein n=1 Tax=Fulvivirga sp. M361 TaxID=2594266 RepID=UPI002105E34B|nr:discoidin domain-containing protein [Fulvivirga sp. M361]
MDFSTQEDQGGEGDTRRAADILDGDKSVYYHSCRSGCTATSSYHISIDMGQSFKMYGFRFTQRQTISRAVKDIKLQISSDISHWESVGNFVLQRASDDQDINLSEPKAFRYFKFIAKSAHDVESRSLKLLVHNSILVKSFK